MKFPSLFSLSLPFLTIALGACVNPSTDMTFFSLEPAGANCPLGGIRVESGNDLNKNGKLGANEIEKTEFICTESAEDIRVTQEPVGPNCQYGGVRIDVGTDENRNGTLDDAEVEKTEYSCNQRVDGRSVAFDIHQEPPGSNCPAGGIKLQMGIDDSDDGILDTDEIDTTNYICHGVARLVNIEPIAAGGECEQGGVKVLAGHDDNANAVLDPEEADTSVNVCSGRASLLGVEVVNPGAACPAGGLRVQSGFDRNGNQVLDSSEAQTTEYACHGVDGLNAIVRQIDELPNPEGACLFGGKRFESGLDRNRNGNLDPEEIEGSGVVCSVQVNEHLTLVRNSVELPGPNCVNGGTRVEVGIDDDNDGILDDSEIDSTTFRCSNVIVIDGLTTLVTTSPASSAQCAFGGIVLRSGLDDNRNGNLEASEADETEIICNGANGFNAVTSSSNYSGSSCGPNGGIQFSSGLDRDRDNTLDSNEIERTSIICHGDDGVTGLNSQISAVDAGNGCGIFGGILIRVGTDSDRDGSFDSNEITSSAYVCNGSDGMNSLVNVRGDGGACGQNGGSYVEVGLDRNVNGRLDSSEVESYTYICNGVNGYHSLIDARVGTYFECGFDYGMNVTVGMDFDSDGRIDFDEVVNEFTLCENWETFYF